MTKPFSYSTTYTLDKSHFSETFDASVTLDNSINAYVKSIVLGLIGSAILLFTAINPFIGWFVVALAALEAVSTRFRKAWWLARQMMSKAASNELTLTVDETGVSSQSFYVNSQISWDEIQKIEQTAQGWLLCHASGKNYVSSRCLSEAANDYIAVQATSKYTSE